MPKLFRTVVTASLIIANSPVLAACQTSDCSADQSALQVLGSGGPIADDERASSGYLLWVDGAAKVMIDVGGGTFLRFGESGAKFGDLDFVGLSHFHTDHSVDFPALLKSGSFTPRDRELVVSGPDGSDLFPGLNDYLAQLLDRERGAYRYLAGYLDGSGGLARIAAFEIAKDSEKPVTVFGDKESDLQIDAMPVPHGIVPALAFRVRMKDSIIVFASDQNGNDDRFVEFAKNADILVMHMVVPEGVSGVGRRLHAPPSVIGAIAQRANVGTLVLSHLMARSLRQLDENIVTVRENFDGDVVLAEDLKRLSLN